MPSSPESVAPPELEVIVGVSDAEDVDSDVDDEAVEDEADGEASLPKPEVYGDLIAADAIDADAMKVLRRLARHGHTAYLVGGGVRDILLGRTPKDFDIATSARPADMRRLFRNCRIIGRRFRLAHILFAGGKVIEVATFRRDPGGDGGAPDGQAGDSGAPGQGRGKGPRKGQGRGQGRGQGQGQGQGQGKERHDDADLLIRHDNTFGVPHEDALRRDFTINGLFYDLEAEEVIDYVGGVADLETGTVRTIGQPDVRFREDPIRILRAIKFGARLDLGIGPEVYDAIVDQRGELSRAAPPRLFEELLRLLRGGAAHRSFYLAWDLGVLGVVLPELSAYLDDSADGSDLTWGRLSAIDEMRADDRLPGDAVLLAALLYGPLSEAVSGSRNPAAAFEEFFDDMVERLAVPRRMRDRVRLLMGAQRRMDRGRHSGMRRREFFLDAAALFETRLSAEGREPPEWLMDLGPRPEAPPAPRKRPRGLRSGGRRSGRTPQQ